MEDISLMGVCLLIRLLILPKKHSRIAVEKAVCLLPFILCSPSFAKLCKNYISFSGTVKEKFGNKIIFGMDTHTSASVCDEEMLIKAKNFVKQYSLNLVEKLDIKKI